MSFYFARLIETRERELQFMEKVVQQAGRLADTRLNGCTIIDDRRFLGLLRVLELYVQAARRTHANTPIATSTIDLIDVLDFTPQEAAEIGNVLARCFKPSLERHGLWQSFLQAGFWRRTGQALSRLFGRSAVRVGTGRML